MPDSNARTCPACGATLEAVQHEGVTVDRCPKDCGLWLDRGELGAVVASEAVARSEAEQAAELESARTVGVRDVVAEAASRAPRPCPVCGTAMRLAEYPGSGIPIDGCDEHGTWLDAHELERIEAFAEGMRRGVGAQPASTVAGVTLPAELRSLIGTRVDPPR